MKHFTHYFKCGNCQKVTVRHQVCKHCGWYKGQPITLKAKEKFQKKLIREQKNTTTTTEPTITEQQQ